MKTKDFINNEDFVLNPHNYFGKLIPMFYPCNTTERGHVNYGAFLACKRANEKASSILNPLVTFFYSENKEEKEEAYAELAKIAEKYVMK